MILNLLREILDFGKDYKVNELFHFVTCQIPGVLKPLETAIINEDEEGIKKNLIEYLRVNWSGPGMIINWTAHYQNKINAYKWIK